MSSYKTKKLISILMESPFYMTLTTQERHSLLSRLNDAFPSEYFSLDELEELMDLLHDMGVEIVDNRYPDITEEEVLASEEKVRSMKKRGHCSSIFP